MEQKKELTDQEMDQMCWEQEKEEMKQMGFDTDGDGQENEKIIEVGEDDTKVIVDIDGKNGEQILLTPQQNYEAQIMASVMASAWIKENPNYTMDELKAVKAEYLYKARKIIFVENRTHEKHEQ